MAGIKKNIKKGFIKETTKKKSHFKDTIKDSGYKKAAEFLILIGKEHASEILKRLSEKEAMGIMKEIADIKIIKDDAARKILEEFGFLFKTSDLVARGGIDKAKEILEGAFGQVKGEAILERILERTIPHPFAFLQDLDFEQVIMLLKNESAPVISVVLAHLEHKLAAQILESIPQDIKKDVVVRIARMSKITPDVLKRTEEALKKKVREQGELITQEIDGENTLIEIMKNMDINTEKRLIVELEENDPELAESLRQSLFTIDVIKQIRDRDLHKLLNDYNDQEIALILKGKEKLIKDKILNNVSSRRRGIIQIEYDTLGEVLKSDAEKITIYFLNQIRSKSENGELIILGRDDKYIE